MKFFDDLRRWIGNGLRRLYPIRLSGNDDNIVDLCEAVQRSALNRNVEATKINEEASRSAGAAMEELLARMEARRNG